MNKSATKRTSKQKSAPDVPTPQQVASTPSLFAEKLLRIQAKDMRLLPLVHNKAQRHFLANRSGRDIILKARQLGFSTAIQGELFRLATTRPSRVTTIGKDDGNTRDLRVIFDRFYMHLPNGFRPARDISNNVETRFPEYDSRAVIAKAGNTSSGRGGTNYAIHLSEVAFYRDASEIVKSVSQAGTPKWIVAESTPNGEQGWFYEETMKAIMSPDETAWRLHFYAWWWDITYTLPLDDDESAQVRATLDDDETTLVNTHGLTPGQIAWRRAKIKEIGKTAFMQEYPEDAITCFQSARGGVMPRFDHLLVDAPDVYEGQFVAGVDWGRADDYTSLSIFDANTNDEVFIARWRGDSYTEIRATIIDILAQWRVMALFAEVNAMQANVEQIAIEIEDSGLDCEVIPFTMTNRRKALIVDWLRQDIEGDAIQLINDSVANAELRAYQESRTATGLPKYEHPQGGHDDTVDARLIAYFGLRQI